MSLQDFSIQELKQELEKRERKAALPPERSSKTNSEIVEQIYKAVQPCLKKSIEDNYWDEDNNIIIFEAAMKAIYGEDYFYWHNKRFS
jgi:hypothetical protein